MNTRRLPKAQPAVLCALLLGLGWSVAPAQSTWPDKPVTMIVPFPPGGVADTVARPVADALSRELKQPIVIENKPGSGGALGMGTAARAAPDGYTILMTLSSISILPEADKLLGRKPAYLLNQFKPIARFTADPTVFVVRADAPWKTLQEFVADARRSRAPTTTAAPATTDDARPDGDAEGAGRLPDDAHPVHRRRSGGHRAARRPGRRGRQRSRRPWSSRSTPASCARSPTGATGRSPRCPACRA
jgi:hypothetical protein